MTLTSQHFQIFADKFEENGKPRQALILRLCADSNLSESSCNAIAQSYGVSSRAIKTLVPQELQSYEYRHKDRIIRAKAVLEWVGSHLESLHKQEREYCRQDTALEASLSGDGEATLANPHARQAVYNKILSNKSGISEFTNRKSSKYAQNKLVARIQRREDREVARKAGTATPGKYSALAQRRLNKFAVHVAESFHEHIKPLYTSSRSYVQYGFGGEVEWDNDAYSKSYGYGAKYQLAGARIVDGEIVIESSRGTEKASIPVPTNRHEITFAGLLDGDIWGRKREIAGIKLIARFKWFRKKVSPSGFSALLTAPEELQGHWPASLTDGQYWEHGSTVAEIKSEYRRKCQVAKESKARKDASAKLHRLARRIAHLCPNLLVVHDDRKAVGFCDAGTQAFIDRYGFVGREQVTAAELRATGSNQVERPIMAAAERLASQILTKKEGN